jgi:hypothetical protein
MRQCSEPGCSRVHEAFGLCKLHYTRLRTRGTTKKHSQEACVTWLIEHAGCYGADCLIWPFFRNSNGYGRITFPSNTKCGFGSTSASRFMCKLVNGEPPTKKHQAAHNCGRGAFGCVNPMHLRWATARENSFDRISHGTANHGERHGNAKLNDDDVRLIREMIRAGSVQRQIAKQFGVTPSVITVIKQGKAWGHLLRDGSSAPTKQEAV